MYYRIIACLQMSLMMVGKLMESRWVVDTVYSMREHDPELV
jgi:hypothetical protein